MSGAGATGALAGIAAADPSHPPASGANGRRRADAVSVALVNNISVEPFRLIAPPWGEGAAPCEWPPSRVWRLAAEGALDLAVVPVAKGPHVAPAMEPIGDFGVACRGAVGSVLLYATAPVVELAAAGSPIHPTTDSETSRRLLGLLWRHEFGVEPVFTSDAGRARAWLCIGDDALRRRLRPDAPPIVVDLCDWWERRTGRPFVFARWMVRRSADDAFKRTATDWLAACADRARSPWGRDTMSERAVTQGLFSDRAAALGYFDALRSRLGRDDLQGEALFQNGLARTGST